MTGTASTLSRAYDFHGLPLVICAEDQAVIEAMDLRLRDFGVDWNAAPEPRVTLEFVSESDAAAAPDGPSRPVYETPHGTLHYFLESDSLCGLFGGVSVRCDAARGVAVLAAEAFAERDLYLATHPLATVSLMELLERRGFYSLHAACLAEDDGAGVLLAGPSGSGKSTLAIALVRAGMSFLSDDLVFLHSPDNTDGDVRTLGFADAVGLTPYAAERFDELRPLLDDLPGKDFPKRLHRIEDLLGARAIPACEPRALVFPELAPSERSSITPLQPGDALLRLVPDVLLTQPRSSQTHLSAISALLGRVRCHSLRFGSDIDRAVALAQALCY